jgi:hypothetical protein
MFFKEIPIQANGEYSTEAPLIGAVVAMTIKGAWQGRTAVVSFNNGPGKSFHPIDNGVYGELKTEDEVRFTGSTMLITVSGDGAAPDLLVTLIGITP